MRQAEILSAFGLHGSGVQLRWAHRPGGLCSTSAEKSRLAASACYLRHLAECSSIVEKFVAEYLRSLTEHDD
ncbi:MAG: hypothetical protein DMF19_03545 [Verrucomicrobia bacterium]|nr:MAG: hypothetical protein DMF19_03545 [Verrucomicrobiota bacterium]